jgi:cytidine deaminase
VADVIDEAALCAAARAAARHAYAPYSRFPVGAAVLGARGIHVGANVENASYPLGLCAERSALARARVEGDTEVRAIAVACIAADPAAGPGPLLPCGACRQWMSELATAELPILVCTADRSFLRFTLEQLLPHPFRLT